MSQYGPNYKTGPGGRKIEPRVREISPAAAGQIGSSLGNHVTDRGKILPRNVISEPLYTGKQGFEPPHDRARTIHTGGSQGRHE